MACSSFGLDSILSAVILQHTRTGFFHSAIEDEVVVSNIRSIVLYCYAKAVLREVEDVEVTIDGEPVTFEIFGVGGKLRDVYHGEDSGRHLIGDDTHETRAIQSFIRKVGVGRTPSAEAQAYARSLGYELGPDETYVRPFVRQQVVLRERQLCGRVTGMLGNSIAE